MGVSTFGASGLGTSGLGASAFGTSTFATWHAWLQRAVLSSTTPAPVLHDHEWRVVAVDYEFFAGSSSMLVLNAKR